MDGRTMIEQFSEFDLSESKNLHLTHIEDLVFDGVKEVESAIEFLKELTNMLSSSGSSKVNATVKWDGAPAIFCGTDPETGDFFVGTKSVFNKTPKVNFTQADIKKNHKGGLAEKLSVALRYLSKLNIKGVLQGDMMYGPGDIKTETVNGESCYTFTPNTITYAVPVDSDLGKRIKRSKIGVVFHTTYSGRTLQTMKANFGANVSRLKKTTSVWFDNADFKDVSGTASLSSGETARMNAFISDIESNFREAKKAFSSLDALPNTRDLLNIYTNAMVRQGSDKLTSSGFISFLNDRFDKAIDGLKSDAGKKKKKTEKENNLANIKTISSNLDAIFAIHFKVQAAKTVLIRKMENIKGIGTFIRTDSGFKTTKPEGFVGIDRYKKGAVKLVDRLEFSKANFSVAKNWG